jgi:o-succinylbenzoate synthase
MTARPVEGPEEATLSSEALGIRENRVPLFLERVEVIRREMRLCRPFESSFGRIDSLVRLFPAIRFRTATGERITGIGECPPLPAPWYDGECDGTVSVALKHLSAALTADPTPVTDSHSFIGRYAWVVGHAMARVGVEGAYWDAVGQLARTPVWRLWGGVRSSVEAGSSIGLEKTAEATLGKVRLAVDEAGVSRIKIKIKPGHDLHYVEAVRRAYPALGLQVDANTAYDLFDPRHVDILRSLDDFGLLMIEQPGKHDDILDHARMLADLATPVCLDESIRHARDARQAVECWRRYSDPSKLVINVKPPRVGGFVEAIRIARLCADHGVAVWCGGMLESALGKAANVHFSARAEVSLPGDHVSQGAYFEQDVATPLPCVKGCIRPPDEPGWGLEHVLLMRHDD